MREDELQRRVAAELKRIIAELEGGLAPSNAELLKATNQTVVRQMTTG